MDQIYKSENNLIRQVEVKETYKNSCHYTVEITPEGYGANPKTLQFGFEVETNLLEQKEGFGIFRAEYAHGIAKLLTAKLTN